MGGWYIMLMLVKLARSEKILFEYRPENMSKLEFTFICPLTHTITFSFSLPMMVFFVFCFIIYLFGRLLYMYQQYLAQLHMVLNIIWEYYIISLPLLCPCCILLDIYKIGYYFQCVLVKVMLRVILSFDIILWMV